MSKKYNYFVSFFVNNKDGGFSFGNASIKTDKKIKTIEQVTAIGEYIKENSGENVSKIIVLNYILESED